MGFVIWRRGRGGDGPDAFARYQSFAAYPESCYDPRVHHLLLKYSDPSCTTQFSHLDKEKDSRKDLF